MAAAIGTFGTHVPAVRALGLGPVSASRHDLLVACEDGKNAYATSPIYARW